MSVLKGYVRNRAHSEGSMIEGYTTEEVGECCIDYIKDVNPIGISLARHEGRGLWEENVSTIMTTEL